MPYSFLCVSVDTTPRPTVYTRAARYTHCSGGGGKELRLRMKNFVSNYIIKSACLLKIRFILVNLYFCVFFFFSKDFLLLLCPSALL